MAISGGRTESQPGMTRTVVSARASSVPLAVSTVATIVGRPAGRVASVVTTACSPAPRSKRPSSRPAPRTTTVTGASPAAR